MSIGETYNTIVIGGGQAGLAAGYYLAQQHQNFAILDASARIGEAWRRRWDSLRLFTPAKFNGLPGMAFPADGYYTPTKDEAADYLEAYAKKFQLPVRLNTQIDRLERVGEDYRLEAGPQSFRTRNVIVATGAYQLPKIPTFASQLDPEVFQLHSSAYRNPDQFPTGRVLVVGAGNSGSEIALELCKDGRQVWLCGRDVGRIPADQIGKYFGGRPYWWFINQVLSIDTPIGRKMRGQVLHHGNPLIRSNRKEILQAGIQTASRLAGVSNGKPCLPDGQILEVEAVVWATGFRPDYRWIGLPVFDEYGFPNHQRGAVPGAKGLYFLGLHFQSRLTSALMGGVGKDAEYITRLTSTS
jgi:putative flavoprotein involved in K+ transport